MTNKIIFLDTNIGVEIAEKTKGLTELSVLIHKNNVKKGFYDDGKKNFGELLMLVVSELGEALEAMRKRRFSNWEKEATDYNEILKNVTNVSGDELEKQLIARRESFSVNIKDTVEDEIADAIIRLFDVCGYYEIDIEKQIRAKLEFNTTRPYKHGKEF
jgi:NTP pyrophosphatase (non-canonical NTP hydrolase)